ncbi:hypothetical protein C9374_009999 [Naegleria lovaniensis]|uniref:Uncharacterized protein n=1 Tax=Naegleria lovaniensis TaxID=51637 RepID=A0AA88GJK2_NAELO|nr:uncharacterized protein C9374_009999 [Naegleria lovaniensis]KAG2375376.1 hypothetical protein C9374_009999 [Naegleria lovaniensis]
MASSNSRFIISIVGSLVGCCVAIIVLAIVLPIGIINSLPPEYCYSTQHLKYLPAGSTIALRKTYGLGRFELFNETGHGDKIENFKFNASSIVGTMKYRSWAIPYRIDLMNAEQKGSAEGRGASFSIGQQVSLHECRNDTTSEFTVLGRISQTNVFEFWKRTYEVYDATTTNKIATVEDKFGINEPFVARTPEGVVVAEFQQITWQLQETWRLSVKYDMPNFDMRSLLILVSVISYNRN